jgi:DNA-binding transcriptional LysR family regulator
MADDLFDMLVFVRVVDAGSLSRAARDLKLSLAVISRKLARLEERLGVRLVNRTTRRLALTEEGAAFHRRCVRILAEIEEAETEVTRGRDRVVGVLRISSTFAFGRRRLAPLLLELQVQHPEMKVELEVSDSVVNLLEGGYDMAIRFGALADSSLVARSLVPDFRVICAASSYLDRRGRPDAIEDILSHDCILYGAPPLDHWTFVDGSAVHVKATLTTNDGELAHVWALHGGGLVLKSIWDVQEDIEAGRLEVVLPRVRLPASAIHAVYPHSRLVASKVRLSVEFLRAKLQRQWAAWRLDTIATE